MMSSITKSQQKQNNAERQAFRNTLKFVRGVNVGSNSICMSLPLFGATIQPSDRLRLAMREYNDDFDRLRIAVCIAVREGLKKTRRPGLFVFRKMEIRLPRNEAVARETAHNTLLALTKLFKEKELEEMRTPITEA